MASPPAISITALHDPISIVHVPVSASMHYSSKVYWTIDRAREDSSEFFNMTSNRIEIALFAHVDLIEDEWGGLPALDSSLRINGQWRVFEISSGDSDDGANDSPHLRHVSAPLAAAGVSILYQSSYFTDFLLVKAEDFDRAQRIFKSRGWDVDPQQPPVRRRSIHVARGEEMGYMPMLSPIPPPPPIAEITVLKSPLACVGMTRETQERNGDRMKKYLVWPERAVAALQRERGEAEATGTPGTPTTMRRRSSSERRSAPPRPFISYTSTEDGASVLTEVRVLRAMFRPEEKDEILCAGELDRTSASESGGWTTGDENSEDESDGDVYGPPSPSPQTSPRHGHSLPGTPKDSWIGGPFSAIPVHWAGSSYSGSGSAATTPTYRTGFGLGVGGMTPIYPTHSRAQSESERTARIIDGLLPRTRRASEGSQRIEAFEDRQPSSPVDSLAPRTMRCLQLDLRGVEGSDDTHLGKCEPDPDGVEGSVLDKSGLVTRFSSVLHKGGVRMLYSSTTHTANLLVRGADVWKAEELLRVGSGEE